MKKLLALLLVFALACTAPAPQTPTTPESPEPAVTATEESAGTVPQPEYISETAVESEPSTAEEAALDIVPYTELGCAQLLTAEQFAKSCVNESSEFVVTYKVGTRNCYVNIKARSNDRLTAGVNLVGLGDNEKALTEFDRRLKVFNVGADKSVGEKAYTFPKQDRETINFVKDEYLVEVASDTRLCSKENLLALAKVVDVHLG